ncbi:class D beta-lactamase [Entomomonas asaccharolytica]|uniref:Beta-lactamase n=1 Tax=Entomomonas asaccharolytica TaxID=2785331 RepID=A0A974RWM9_9GAMM|nr:class D beta-lactamase [Entomomonas asaccharolytica]QQP85368.1 class D beta-lactamase [Entomomonas asaccharolytica]
MNKLFFCILFLFTQMSYAISWYDNKEIDQLFIDSNTVGTFVVYDVQQHQLIGYNQIRANTRFIPASTFKIVNSLIGLATKTIKNVDEKLPYGGKSYSRAEWQRDMGLRDAIKVSNLPIYQELARRIGIAQMQANIKLLNYGNTNIGQVVDDFWLVGPFKISAVEQAIFLADLAQQTLPYDKEVQQTIHEITLLEQGENWQLHGKTGWADNHQPDVGWFVGWVEKEGKVYSFAINIDMLDPKKDIAKRVDIAKQSLKLLGIL